MVRRALWRKQHRHKREEMLELGASEVRGGAASKPGSAVRGLGPDTPTLVENTLGRFVFRLKPLEMHTWWPVDFLSAMAPSTWPRLPRCPYIASVTIYFRIGHMPAERLRLRIGLHAGRWH